MEKYSTITITKFSCNIKMMNHTRLFAHFGYNQYLNNAFVRDRYQLLLF